MIAREVIQGIERLLAEGKLSQRKIAELTGVSRGTVGAVADGRRLSAAPEDETTPVGPAVRCPGCGGLVYLPCRLCKLRKRGLLRKKPIASEDRESAELRLELNEQQQARYEKLHARKLEEHPRRESLEEAAGRWARPEPEHGEDSLPGVLGRVPDFFAPVEEEP